MENFFKRIRNIFKKKQQVEMLPEGQKTKANSEENFKSSLKVNVRPILQKRKGVETNVCEGDGLGINSKMGC